MIISGAYSGKRNLMKTEHLNSKNNNSQNLSGYQKSAGNPVTLIPTRDYPYAYRFDYFNPVQSCVYKYKGYSNNMIIGANTSAGKTIAAELLIDATLARKQRVIYMSPLKALTEEKFAEWKNRYSGERLIIMTGDYQLNQADYDKLQTSNIIVMTSEMMDSRTRKFHFEKNYWMKEVGLVVVDESHILTTSRGDAVETGLMRFTAHCSNARIVFLSATMPNLFELGGWLTSLNGKRTDIIQSSWRPVELQKYYLEYPEAINERGLFDYRATEFNKLQLAIRLVLSKPHEKFLLFVHSKKTGWALLHLLKKCGIAARFHNADLSLNKRQRLQESFRDCDNGIRVLVSTSTTAWGVNLPARNVVIVGVHRGISQVDELDIIQMAGRAGRFGIDDEGHVFLIIPEGTSYHWQNIFISPRPVISVLNSRRKLAFHVVAEIYRKAIKSETDLFRWYGRSLSYRQGLTPFSKNEAESVLKDLKCLKMIYEKNDRLKVTSLGILSAIMYYSPYDIHAWYQNFNSIFFNNLDSDEFALAWALGNIPSNKSFIPKDCAHLKIDWHNRLAGFVNHFDTDTVIGVEAAFDCLRGLKGIGMVGSKMRELLYNAPRIIRTLQTMDERYARWGRKSFWEKLEARLIQKKSEKRVRNHNGKNRIYPVYNSSDRVTP